MNTVHDKAVRCLARVMRLQPAQAAALDADADLSTALGLTSLDRILFLTSVCEACGVPLTLLDDVDLAEATTLKKVEELIERKQTLERQLARESGQAEARVERLSASARDIRDLLETLAEQRRQEESRRKAEEERRRQEEERREASLRPSRPPQAAPTPEVEVAIRPDAGARGLRTLPVTGKLVSNFGQNTESGGPARGMTIQCRALAVVVAPDAGRVLFAGPFRGYGQILIIEHAGGYHSLLSGLGRIDSEVGSTVRAGEPVGLTGSGQAGRAADEGGRGQGSTLYFELRRNGQPTNPAGWLSAERTR